MCYDSNYYANCDYEPDYNYCSQSSDETYNYTNYPNFEFDTAQMTNTYYDNSSEYSDSAHVEDSDR